MILEIQHETRLEYGGAVTEDVTEVRMEPGSDADQSCRSFHLKVSPPAEVHNYVDGFGNRVHYFNLLAAHSQVTILAASVVETHPAAGDSLGGQGRYPLDPALVPLDAVGFFAFHGPVRPTPLLGPVLEALRPTPGEPLGRLVARVSAFIKEQFEYAPDVTHAASPIDDVLREGKGVCQDFAHLMIGVLRSFGVPARYVSGYIHRPGRESQSHAWAEAWLPESGWVAMDPTHDRPRTDDLVKVAVGRDFTDVPPNRGVYRGDAAQATSVRVETRALTRLPPLSWREQLPPLQVPLRTILPRLATAGPSPVDVEQQQQQ
jgi:transglutaminase-like putative cysteine protease